MSALVVKSSLTVSAAISALLDLEESRTVNVLQIVALLATHYVVHSPTLLAVLPVNLVTWEVVDKIVLGVRFETPGVIVSP